MMDKDILIESAIKVFESKKYEFDLFRDAVVGYFVKRPEMDGVIHSIKSRIKNVDHLRKKINRKWDEDDPISDQNIFKQITDFAGVRVLHLYQEQFSKIHSSILSKVSSKDWFQAERPKAYTWDPESVEYFEKYDLEVERKESFYTSVHYLVKPREDSPVCCEIQVRTLFEEIWGEVDHILNYPNHTPITACKEQIRVLAKLVGAGSRLVDSIFRTSQIEYTAKKF